MTSKRSSKVYGSDETTKYETAHPGKTILRFRPIESSNPTRVDKKTVPPTGFITIPAAYSLHLIF